MALPFALVSSPEDAFDYALSRLAIAEAEFRYGVGSAEAVAEAREAVAAAKAAR